MGDYYLGWGFWRNVLSLIIALLIVAYFANKNLEGIGQKSKRSAPLTSDEQYQVEYKKLLAAVLHDYGQADKLIASEHTLAGSIGIGKVEAAKRALDRLQRNRSS